MLFPSELALKTALQQQAATLGFTQLRVSAPHLPPQHADALNAWLAAGYHGTMDYMAKHGLKRVRPTELIPGTRSVISVALPYWPPASAAAQTVLANPQQAYIARYALGRDYHKTLRTRLQQLAQWLQQTVAGAAVRVFTDSAPVAEVALATQAGLGWRGKHTLLLNRSGSYFFLGEILTDVALPPDGVIDEHCGRCQCCQSVCPTQAIIAPYVLDARRCISYLTIEYRGVIPLALRPLLGNRVYGCDDCQLVCPWNRFAHPTQEQDFRVRHGLDAPDLLALWHWNAEDFYQRMAGSPIYRIGFECWRRNLAVALGNAPASAAVVTALSHALPQAGALVAEHIDWALAQQKQNSACALAKPPA